MPLHAKILARLTCCATLLASATSCVTSSDAVVNKSGAFSVICRESERYTARDWATLECTTAGQSSQATSIRFERLEFDTRVGARLATAGEIDSRPALVQENGSISSLAGLALVGAVAMASKGQAGPVSSVAVVGIGVTAGSNATSSHSRPSASTPTEYGTDHLLGPAFALSSGESKSRMALLAIGSSGEMPESVLLCTALPEKECITTPIQLWAGRARLRQ